MNLNVFDKWGIRVVEKQLFKIIENMINIMTCVHMRHCLHLSGQNLLEITP